MATAVQVAAILDDVLRLPAGTSAMAAKFLRAGGLLPSTQGIPTQLSNDEVGSLLLAVVLGSPCSGDSAETVRSYTAMLPISGGANFGSTLANFIARPEDIFELRIDAAAPGATMTYRAADRGMRTAIFASAEHHPRPAFDREIRVGPEVFIRIAAAIRNAPEVRVGRRRLAERYQRYETTSKF